MFIRPLPALLAACAIASTSCREAKIRSYQIAKEENPPAVAPATPSSTSALPAIHWQKPDGWQEQPARSMRVASFSVASPDGRQADLAITTFPGDVGGDFANVNRWRGQIQLPPIAETELPGVIALIDLPAGKFLWVDLTSDATLIDGKYRARILGAWLKQADRTWFFKLAGESDLVESQREVFFAFLRSVSFDPAATIAAPSATANSPAMPPALGETPVPTAENSLAWTPPAAWTAKPLGPMRRGSYAAGEADVSITQFAAATNPLLENLNRWRRQIGLAPLEQTDLPGQTVAVAAGDLSFTTVDFTHSGSRVVGAILYRGDEAWFFKLSGPDAAVAAQKDAFIAFLKTVKAR